MTLSASSEVFERNPVHVT